MKYLYVIKLSRGPLKIGYAGDPKKRLISLRTTLNDKNLELLFVFPVGYDPRVARLVEDVTHNFLLDKNDTERGQRELFWVSLEEATSAIQKAYIEVTSGNIKSRKHLMEISPGFRERHMRYFWGDAYVEPS